MRNSGCGRRLGRLALRQRLCQECGCRELFGGRNGNCRGLDCFNSKLFKRDASAVKAAWQRYYFKGELPEETGPAPKGHTNKRRMKSLKLAFWRGPRATLAKARTLCDKPPPDRAACVCRTSRSAGVAQG